MITDFGLAKQTGSKADLTRSGMLIGTPAYMSPEQARRTSQSGRPAERRLLTRLRACTLH